MRSLLATLPLLAFPIAATAQGITVQWPNGGAPCTAGTTLQACIDAVPDESTIVLNLPLGTAIGEDIQIEGRVLTVRGYPGTRPEMAPFRFFGVVEGRVRVENLTLRGRGITGISTDLELHRIRVFDVRNTGIELREGQTTPAASMRLRLTESEIVGESGEAEEQTLVSVSRHTAGTVTAEIAFNTLRPSTGQGHAIELDCYSADCEYDVRHNDIRGQRYNGGIGANSNGAATVRLDVIGNLIDGQWGNVGGAGTIAVRLDEATSTVNVINNTIVRSRRGIALSTQPELGGSMQGIIANNLVAYLETYSVCVPDTLLLRNNLTWQNGGDDGPLPNLGARTAKGGQIGACQPPGQGNLHADPRLDGVRLRADSPARDAGDTNSLESEVLAGRVMDLDGMRRIVGANVDIGAYEHDTRLRTERVRHHFSTTGLLPWPLVGDASHPYPIYSPVLAHPWLPVAPPQRTVVAPYTDTGRWGIDAIDVVFPDNAAYAVFAPQPWRGSANVGVNVHNSRLNGTAIEIDHAQVFDGDPLFFVRSSFGPALNHQVCRAEDLWSRHHLLRHADDAPMPEGTSFLVYTQSASPNAFTHVNSFYNGGGTYSVVDHPLLNGNQCARPMVAPADCRNPHPIGMRFGGGRWEVYNADSSTLDYGASFFVFVDPRQIDAECGPRVFADDFE